MLGEAHRNLVEVVVVLSLWEPKCWNRLFKLRISDMPLSVRLVLHELCMLLHHVKRVRRVHAVVDHL